MTNQASKVKLLIVEDEILLANDIANRLSDNNYTIVGIADTAIKALDFLSKNQDIDMVLIDIILKGDRDGIELARIINDTYNIPFLFLTSHADSYLIERAKSVRPYAYLLKPFNDRQVSIAIELALKNFAIKMPEKQILGQKTFLPTENQVLQIKDSLFLKKSQHFERVPIEEILFLEADSNYCTVYTRTDRFMYSVGLNKIEAQLPPDRFLRIHRSYVVNINLVDGFEGNMLFIGENKLPVSKSHKENVFRLFRTI
ncbi:LytTR family transcriptional regulator DNA-binding domain-containing protein [uncultured Kriegella sp.]|uniref:LytR/AlgR family response regulator transcription factor n=1 Tax=uncultured Kriegella sp. TaxID=1798910 RepID=UPI0030DB34D7|tara:strand:+ start:43046 stop:43816 length:771 start_codon:yes stop_codon:yes gene_type:complete